MNWIKVDSNNPAILPPLGQVVWIIYTSGYDGGLVMQLGGRADVGYVDSDYGNWAWGVLDSKEFARNWEPKLYDIECDDDYNVTHWAALEWPEDYSQ